MVNERDLVVESGRVKGVTVTKPIVYGNIAKYFGKKRDEDGHTHQWTIFVKPYKNEDLSHFVKKVQFKLHDSYANPNRIITSPPYEVSETGWGEFEIVVRIYFEDGVEKPVTIYHILKLFQNDPLIMAGKKPVVHEFYDELVFNEPSLQLYKLLSTPRPLTSVESFKKSTFDQIKGAQEMVRNEISEMKESLKEAKDVVYRYKNAIKELEDNDVELDS